MKSIKIASRASKLALIQSNYIRELLEKLCPDINISIVEVSTKGDRDKSDFLYKSSSVGFFTSEIEKALLEKRADIAVHSLKDLPTKIQEGLTVAAIPKREDVSDVLVAADGINSISQLPARATVGTSSLRRIAQLKHLRPDLNCVPLRGNVETRVKKVAAGEVNAAIMACAGLNRLGMSDSISERLDPKQFLPAPAQGALAVQIRTDDSELYELISKLDDKNSRITAETERHVLSFMHGGCSIPLGVYSKIDGDSIEINALLSDIKAKTRIEYSVKSSIENAKHTAENIATKLLDSGGQEILKSIRKK